MDIVCEGNVDDVDCQSMDKEETTGLAEPSETPLLQTSLSNTYRSQTAASILGQLSAASQKRMNGSLERPSNTLDGERSGQKTKRKKKRRLSFDAK